MIGSKPILLFACFPNLVFVLRQVAVAITRITVCKTKQKQKVLSRDGCLALVARNASLPVGGTNIILQIKDVLMCVNLLYSPAEKFFFGNGLQILRSHAFVPLIWSYCTVLVVVAYFLHYYASPIGIVRSLCSNNSRLPLWATKVDFWFDRDIPVEHR